MRQVASFLGHVRLKHAIALLACGMVLVAVLPNFVHAADTFKNVFVTNETVEQAIPTRAVETTDVAGTVQIGNLPTIQQISGTVDVAEQQIRRGAGTIALEPSYPRSLGVPQDVILTDLMLRRETVSGSAEVCDVWLAEDTAAVSTALYRLGPSAAEPNAELHLETGVGYSHDTEAIHVFVNSNCRIEVLWTGYTAG